MEDRLGDRVVEVAVEVGHYSASSVSVNLIKAVKTQICNQIVLSSIPKNSKFLKNSKFNLLKSSDSWFNS